MNTDDLSPEDRRIVQDMEERLRRKAARAKGCPGDCRMCVAVTTRAERLEADLRAADEAATGLTPTTRAQSLAARRRQAFARFGQDVAVALRQYGCSTPDGAA